MPVRVRQSGRTVRSGQPAAAAREVVVWKERYLANRMSEEDKLRDRESF